MAIALHKPIRHASGEHDIMVLSDNGPVVYAFSAK